MSTLRTLPLQPTPFIGRKDAREAICRLLDDPNCRLLTLVGTGGIGKTRLALEVAAEIGSGYLDGVVFVALQPMIAPDQVIRAIADAVHFQFFGTTDAKIELLNHLASLTALLVIDNFEHLLDCATLLSEIVTHAPQVKLVVTSREVLNLREEWVYRVEAMNYPSADILPESLDHYDAVLLFEQLAHRAQSQFSLTDEYFYVVRICQRVDGLPLALELAAAWLRHLPCSEIVAELNRSLDILASSTRNLETCHRSMRGMFDHSWALLTDHERDTMMQASVFRNGFTRHAAHAVMGASLETLGDLVDKSMLRVDARGRYHLHELTRQYAAERLDVAQFTETARHVHSVYYLNFVAERELDLVGQRQLTARAEILAEMENFRTAWQTALETKNGEVVYRVLDAMRLFFDLISQQEQAVALLLEAEAHFPPSYVLSDNLYPGLLHAWIVAQRMWSNWAGTKPNIDNFPEELADILGIAESAKDKRLMAFSRYLIALTQLNLIPIQICLPIFRECMKLFQDVNDRFLAAECLVWIGVCHRNAGHYFEMIGYLEQALAIFLSDGNKHAAAWTMANLGHMQAMINMTSEEKRYLDNGAQYLSKAKTYFDEINTSKGKAYLLYIENYIATNSGDFERGERVAQERMSLAQTEEIFYEENAVSLSLAIVMILQGDYVRGRQLLEQLFVRPGSGFNYQFGNAVIACVEGDLKAARQHFRALVELMTPETFPYWVTWILSLGAAILGKSPGTNRRMNVMRAVQFIGLVFHYPTSMKGLLNRWKLINDLRVELEAELGTAAYNAAWEYGKSRDLAEVFYELQVEFGVIQVESDAPVVTANPDDLTEREREILALIASGASNRDIADSLVLALGTVKWYITQIYGKLGVNSRTQAVAHARKYGLLA